MSTTAESLIRPDDVTNWPTLQLHLDQAMKCSNDGDWDGATTAAREALTLYPANPEPYLILAIIAFICRDEAQAVKMAETAHEMDPDIREYAELLATINARIGNLSDAVYYAKITETCESHPYLQSNMPSHFMDFSAAMKSAAPSRHNIEGQRSFNEANYGLALKEFNAEIGLNPNNIEALRFLVRTALIMGSYQQAVGAAQSLFHKDPEDSLALALLARALTFLGREAEAVAVARQAIARAQVEVDAEVYLTAMDALQRCSTVPDEMLITAASAFQAAFDAENPRDPLPPVADDSPPHVGYVSNAFFRTPNVEHALGWLLAQPKSKDCTLSGYQFSVARDGITTNLRGVFDNWRRVHDIDPYTLSITLASEGLDVLVDTSQIDGLTCGMILGLAPAPVRVGAVVLPEPGLAPSVTHVLSDETLAAADRRMLMDGQSLITVPGTLYTRLPLATVAQDTTPPMLENGYPTFAANASLPALSPESALMFGQLLRAIDGARLLLFGADLIAAEARTRIREYFMHAGVVDRILFVEGAGDEGEREVSAVERLEISVPASYWREVDVFLDTYPLNGHREMQEALWAGVPVVSRCGTRRASNVGASILAAAGRPNWIARDAEAFVTTAQELVQSAEGLAGQRQALQSAIASTPLFDPSATAAGIRRALIDAARAARKSAE